MNIKFKLIAPGGSSVYVVVTIGPEVRRLVPVCESNIFFMNLHVLVPVCAAKKGSMTNLHSTISHFDEGLDLRLQQPQELGHVPLGHLLVVAEEGQEGSAVATG